MKKKSALAIVLLISMLSFYTLIYSSHSQTTYFNFENFSAESDPNIVTRRNFILNFLRLNFWVSGMRGFSDGMGGYVELSDTYEGITATTSILGQVGGMSLDFFFDATANMIGSLWNVTKKAYGRYSLFDVDLYSTYYAAAALKLIGRSADPILVDYVHGLQNDDGGFGSRDTESSSISATYYAILLLKMFGRLDLLGNATAWLNNTQNLNVGSENYGAFTSNKSDPVYSIYSTYQALAAIYCANGSFSSFTGINITAAARWIASLQNLNLGTGTLSDFGGFTNPGDLKSSISASHAAVAALSLINGLHLIRGFELIAWVFSCQPIIYGGFASSPATASSSVSATYHALEILKIYQWPMLLLYTKIPWQLSVGLPWYGWMFVILISISVSIGLLYAIWKRFKR